MSKVNEEYKCEVCNKIVVTSEMRGSFYIRVMNKSKDNEHFGMATINLYFCSWDCIEKFINTEK